jgi:hypothetical protein
MGIESPDPIPPDATRELFGRAERSSRGRVDLATLSTRVAFQGVPTPPLEGGLSRIEI